MAIVTQSTRCTVDIVTPASTHVTFTTDEPQRDLLHVETQKDINQACGSFTLTFAPTVDERGRTWDERIPMRSLVTIQMERPDEPDMPQVESTVMIGITDTHAHTEDWRQAQPQRRSTISGREIACIMLDAELWFHQALEGQPGVIGAQVAAAGLERIRLQWQPDLAGSGDDPRDTLAAILQYFLLGGFTPSATRKVSPAPKTEGKGQEAVINLQFPERALDTLLVLNKSAWSLFEDGVTVAIANNSAFVGSVWNYLHIFIDESFQEFFSRVEKGASYLYFRGKPFKKTPVTQGTRFVENDPTLQTLFLEPRWVLAAALAYQSSSVYNVFWCQPMGMQRYLDKTGFKYLIPPEMLTDARHPSFVGRYGLRVMNVDSPYLPALQPPTPVPGSSQSGLAPKAAAPVTPTVPAAPANFLPLPAVDVSKVPSTARIPAEKLNPTKQYYATLAAQIAKEQGVPESMVPSFLANIEQESGWNPDAKGPTNDLGIAQFTPGTAAAYGLIKDGVDYRTDAVRALTASAQYWRDLTKALGPNPDLVAAGYNAGQGAVQRAGGVPASAATHVANVKRRLPFYTSNNTPSAQPSASPPTAPAPRVAPGSATAAPPPASGTPIQPVVDVAKRWSKYLRAWYDSGPILAVGSFTVRGHPSWNVGHRLVMIDERGEREFYIEGVGHRYDLRSGHYVTSLRVTRGWYTDERPARVPPAGVLDDLTAGTIEQTPLTGGD